MNKILNELFINDLIGALAPAEREKLKVFSELASSGSVRCETMIDWAYYYTTTKKIEGLLK